MATLTLYGSNVAATSLTTASQLSLTTGGTETHTQSTTSTVLTNPAYIEMWSLGTVGGALCASSLPGTPSGNGWLYDSTFLEGRTISSGTWTVIVALSDPADGPLFTNGEDVVVRFWKWKSGPTWTSIGTASITAQTILDTRATFTATGSLSSMSFSAGEKLYVELYLNKTAGSTWSSLHPWVYLSNSGSSGVANDFQITTPSYAYNLSSGTRSKFYTQIKGLTDQTRSKFYTSVLSLASKSASKFITALSLKGSAADRFLTSKSLKTKSADKFITALAISTKATSKFFTSMIALGSRTRAVFSTRSHFSVPTSALFKTAKSLISTTQDRFKNNAVIISQWFKILFTSVVGLINLSFSVSQFINLTFGDPPMSNPYSSIQIAVTAVNASNQALASLASLTCVVTFPDGTVSPTYSLSSGIVNSGGGVYKLIYTTKGPGMNTELWTATDSFGDTAQFQNRTAVTY